MRRVYHGHDGLELVCTELGTGPLVVLLHAGGERRRVWEPVAEAVAAAGFRCVVVDQRGHGETGGKTSRFIDFVEDASCLLDQLGEPAWLVGCSLGGLVSLLAYERGAGRVAGIVLVDVVPELRRERAHAYLRSVESSARPWDWALVEDILQASPVLCEAAVSCRAPLFLVCGEHGTLGEEGIASLQALVPHVVTREIPGAGHLVARDQPVRLAQALLELLPCPTAVSKDGGPA